MNKGLRKGRSSKKKGRGGAVFGQRERKRKKKRLFIILFRIINIKTYKNR